MEVNLYDHDVVDLSAVRTAVSALDERLLPIWSHRAVQSLNAKPNRDGAR